MNEREFQAKFKEFIVVRGFRVVKELKNSSPDMIVEKEGKKIGVEFKTGKDQFEFARALGQLFFAKSEFNVDALWFVVLTDITIQSRKWVQLFHKHKIKIFTFQKNRLKRVREKNLVKISVFKSRKKCQQILATIQKHPDGISFGDIATELNMEKSNVAFHIKGTMTSKNGFQGGKLLNKVIVEGNMVKPLRHAKGVSQEMINAIKKALEKSKESSQNEDIFYLKQTDTI